MNDFIFSRKIILSFIALLALCCSSYAQNSVTLVFTGEDQHGSHIKMNGITIQNLSRNWQETILFPDTVYTLNIGTGIDDIQEANEMKVMPNPFDGRTRVNIFSTKDENAKMVLVDINGKMHARYEGRLTTGDNFFDITLTTPQTYILSIQTQSGIRNLKMVNVGHAGSNRISFVSNIPKSVKVSIKSSSSHDFELGDEMQYIGFAQIYNHITQSMPIQQVQFTSEEIELVFDGYRIEVSTDSVSFADNTTFVCYGTVNTFGSGTVQTGFCWDNQPNPTLANNHISSGMANHSFTSTLTGMNPISNFHIRAYAINGTDTVYGENIYCPPMKASFTQTDTAFIPDGVDCGNGCIYGSSIEVSGFAHTATIHNTDDILYARLKLEHTYMGDIYVALTCPPDPVTGIRKSAKILKKYGSSTTTPCSSNIPSNGWGWNVTTGVGSGSDFGAALHTDSDDDCDPSTNPMGTAWNYCWSNNTANGYQYANGQGYVYESVNQGHHLQNSVDSSNMTNMTNIYHPDESLASLIGCPINGTWSINIIDAWYGDNGWITEWEIAIGGRNSTATAELDSTLIHPCQNITTVTDFDGNVYHTVAIGNQCWLRENMRTTHYTNGEDINTGNGTSISSAYYYMPEELGEDSIAGYLYNWTAVVDSASQGATGTNIIQGICPYGWHIPSDAEWYQLTEYLSFSDEFACGENSSSIAKSLAAKTDWNISNNACAVGNNLSSNNSTSFSAFPAGNAYGIPYDYGKYANYWTSTAYNSDFAYYYSLSYDNSFVERNKFGYKCNGMSVRCIRNKGVPIFLPSISTLDVSQITEYSALCGGNISSTGGAAITERGVCWSTTYNPTINDNHIIDTSGLNTFSCTMMNLAYNTTYYVRAYAINEAGIAYGEQKSFDTPAPSITVTTAQTSDISCHSATSGGNITAGNPYAVNARGVCWSTSPNPTIANNHTVDGSGDGDFTSIITGLQHSTTYHVRAYAVYYNNDTIYGGQRSFVTPSELPTVTTATLSDISYTTASCGGEVTYEGITAVTARGICWSTSPNPSTNDNYTTDSSGMGSFSSSITGLQPNTRYYVRAYATNSAGTAYGAQRYFNTLAPTPTVSTSTISDISYTSATCGGEVTNEGFTSVTARGVCWSTSQNPTINDNHTTDSTGFGTFTSTLTELYINILYYVRAYAINSYGIAYGNQISFTTLNTPTINTKTATNIMGNTASCGGNITSDGGGAILNKGICWSTSPNPTINDSIKIDTSSSYNFTCEMTGLSLGTTYYVKAFASNGGGLVYGAQRNFSTKDIPTITLDSATNVTSTSASSTYHITQTGGMNVSAKGICYSTSPNPTLDDSIVVGTSNTGTLQLQELTPNTTYYVRAFATNAIGTAYSNQVNFTTLTIPVLANTTVLDVSFFTVIVEGEVLAIEVPPVTTRGFCWSTSQNPTITDNHTIDTIPTDSTSFDIFTSQITNLDLNTQYFVRAYAINSSGIGYSNQTTFTTLNTPTITTKTISNIMDSTATCGGNITSTGGGTIISKGICWSTSPNPTISNSTAIDTSVQNDFSCSMTGLYPGITYYVRAFAANGGGLAYGTQRSFTTKNIPTVVLDSVTDMLNTSVFCTGHITNNGGYSVTTRGFCYDTLPNPTLANNFTTNGTGIGTFSGQLDGLTPGITYFVRAYATNLLGTAYSNQITITISTIPTLTTAAVSDIGFFSATGGGEVLYTEIPEILARGICWSTSPLPTLEDNYTIDSTFTNSNGFGVFSNQMTGLMPNSTYYVRAYATNISGTGYGNQVIFSTSRTPTVSTKVVTNILDSTATCGGNIASIGGGALTTKGICWSISQNPTIDDNTAIDTSEQTNYTCQMTALIPGTTYYVRAFAANEGGISYGNQRSFVTSTLPTVCLDSVYVQSITANCNYTILSNGGLPLTAYGLCWSTMPNPDLNDSILDFNSNFIGSVTSVISGLIPGTTYYMRAYATNAIGTTYSNQISFTTLTIPTVITANVNEISYNMVLSGGEVLTTGVPAIIARGICWSTSPNPTIANNHTTDGMGFGVFTSQFTGLTGGTNYYVRAYATNVNGTAYGNEISFTTSWCPGATSVTDIDSNIYNTVQIGNQCWMKENLRTTRYSDGTIIPTSWQNDLSIAYRYVPNGDTSIVPVYGYLYNWSAVMHGASSSSANPSGVQGVCPIGWHVPSDAEWTQLENYVSSQSTYICGDNTNNIAKALSSNSGWSSYGTTCTVGNNQIDNNATGFSAYPAGKYNAYSQDWGNQTYLWSTTGHQVIKAFTRVIQHNDVKVSRYTYSISIGFSVRCLRD